MLLRAVSLSNGFKDSSDCKSLIFEKQYKISNFIISAKAGIQYYQTFPRFRVKPEMTNKGVRQRSQPVIFTRILDPLTPEPLSTTNYFGDCPNFKP
jgi:hypothetical protein